MDLEDSLKAKKSKTELKRRETVARGNRTVGTNLATRQVCAILAILQSKIEKRGLRKVLAAIKEL